MPALWAGLAVAIGIAALYALVGRGGSDGNEVSAGGQGGKYAYAVGSRAPVSPRRP